jgi:hypothetical protein
MNEPVSEISVMLGGHPVILDLNPPVVSPVKDCTIPLPVRPQDQKRVDEKYPLTGHRSLDALSGTDWNQPEERMVP